VDGLNEKTQDREVLEKELGAPGPERIWYVGDAFAMGMSVDEVFALTKIDPWFLVQIEEIVKIELELETTTLDALSRDELLTLKKKGFSDRRLARQLKTTDKVIRDKRHELGIRPVYKRVDTCAAEFATNTAYMYSTYEAATYGGVANAQSPPTTGRSWCWAVAPTASARASSSTTAACTRRWPCAKTGTRPSWSTATPRPCPPTTTPPTACTSSR
jgi:carbamoyl-phosphate synthase large subunit